MKKLLLITLPLTCSLGMGTAFAMEQQVPASAAAPKPGMTSCYSCANIVMEPELVRAMCRGDCDIMKHWLEHGAKVDGRDKDGRTGLMEAARQGKLNVVRCLVEHGADIGARDNDDNTVLMEAASAGSVDCVRYLVERGAGSGARDTKDRTALMAAAKIGGLDVVRYLVEHGADSCARDKWGESALYYAQDSFEGLVQHYERDLPMRRGRTESEDRTYKEQKLKLPEVIHYLADLEQRRIMLAMLLAGHDRGWVFPSEHAGAGGALAGAVKTSVYKKTADKWWASNWFGLKLRREKRRRILALLLIGEELGCTKNKDFPPEYVCNNGVLDLIVLRVMLDQKTFMESL